MYCLDTYALVEIHSRSPNYAFMVDNDFIITELTLAEFYLIMLQKYDKKTADYWFDNLSSKAIIIPKEIMKKAMIFKNENRQKHLTFFDAQGYIFSQEKGHEFVTGDKQFKGLKGVLFVK